MAFKSEINIYNVILLALHVKWLDFSAKLKWLTVMVNYNLMFSSLFLNNNFWK